GGPKGPPWGSPRAVEVDVPERAKRARATENAHGGPKGPPWGSPRAVEVDVPERAKRARATENAHGGPKKKRRPRPSLQRVSNVLANIRGHHRKLGGNQAGSDGRARSRHEKCQGLSIFDRSGRKPLHPWPSRSDLDGGPPQVQSEPCSAPGMRRAGFSLSLVLLGVGCYEGRDLDEGMANETGDPGDGDPGDGDPGDGDPGDGDPGDGDPGDGDPGDGDPGDGDPGDGDGDPGDGPSPQEIA